ncbi:MAG TPA: AraC family transcriptional regulator [Thermoanaerobaculia bacterium]|nr:AraC family transcriptional regulator [Thermoanaerobaculia bacterium]
MAVHEIAPSAELAEFIDAYWWSDEESDARIVPDGCADVIFDGREAFVVGTMTRSIDTRSSAGMFGIRFRPGRAALALRAPLTEITDGRAPLLDLTKRFPHVTIENADNAMRKVFVDVRPDRRVDAAVEAIMRSAGRASIDSIAATIGISRQHLARAFAYHVGVSPKTFARVMRFRRALALGDKLAGAELAAELGYFDQSHLIAEFREFAGTTPVPFFLSRSE